MIDKIEVGRYYERKGRIIKIEAIYDDQVVFIEDRKYFIHSSKEHLLKTCNKLKISTIDFLKLKR